MNKLLLCLMLTVGVCYAKINYNKVMDDLGGNCRFKNESQPGDETIYFNCDSGYVRFHFDEEEIYLLVRIRDSENKKIKFSFLFNRGWNKKGKQIHKNKSVIILMHDEFDIVTAAEESSWDGKIYDFYEQFKENVYYEKQETVKHKQTNNAKKEIEENNLAIETILTNRTDCPTSWQVSGRCLKSYFTDNDTPVQQMESESLSENCWGDPNGSWFCE